MTTEEMREKADAISVLADTFGNTAHANAFAEQLRLRATVFSCTAEICERLDRLIEKMEEKR